MFTTEHIIKTTAKFDEILAKRPRPRDASDSPVAYNNLTLTRKLNKAKFPVYLTSSRVNKQNYAMKIFTNIGEESQGLYQNEVRFASLKHPNVIDIVNYEEDRLTLQRGQVKKISYILMEFAPHGDFFGFIINNKAHFDEKLTRTYFRQLINGIEYLHERGVAHLDLKPENLLLGADLNLKIADFDLSHANGDDKILSGGTRNYRGPEFIRTTPSEIKLESPFAADIYSAGVILFIFMSGGMFPHCENQIVAGIDFATLMYRNPEKFWAKHCEIQKKDVSYFCNDFKELFNNMVKFNPSERLSIRQIKQSKWYNGPIYTPLELEDKMKKIIYH